MLPSVYLIAPVNRILYSMLNVTYCHILLLFAISEKRVDQNNRVYFVNHKNRTTQWEDPRIQGYDVLLS